MDRSDPWAQERPAAKPSAPRPAPPADGRRDGERENSRAAPPKAATEDKQGHKEVAAKTPDKIAAATSLRRALSRCSDSASRPLAERVVLWHRRLKQTSQADELVSQFEAARSSCELPDWRDEAALLDLLQQRVETEHAAEVVLSHFAGEPDAQRFVAKSILRRTVDLRLAAAVSRVLFGSTVDWAKVDRDILDARTPDAKLLRLRAAILQAPGDPQGDLRLVRILAQQGDREGAIAHGLRLRDRGFVTPSLAQQLGDVLSDAGEKDAALRTYSELVEFDPASPLSRRVLGDIYMRQGWYAAAYRQYKTLTDLDKKGPLGWLRLASAAAGSGRIDEALRIERDVASGEGSPGPNDPRYFARLASAAHLAALLADPASPGKDAVARELKKLQLFSGPGALALLTWEDYDAQLVLAAADETKERLTGEATDAGAAGLYGLLLRSDAWDKQGWAVRYVSEPVARPLRFQIARLTWDGKSFTVVVSKGEVKPGDKQAAI
jgi:tetratricopeptide (TPR) repeat protein